MRLPNKSGNLYKLRYLLIFCKNLIFEQFLYHTLDKLLQLMLHLKGGLKNLIS